MKGGLFLLMMFQRHLFENISMLYKMEFWNKKTKTKCRIKTTYAVMSETAPRYNRHTSRLSFSQISEKLLVCTAFSGLRIMFSDLSYTQQVSFFENFKKVHQNLKMSDELTKCTQ
jgi:hypothetical protein